MLKGRDPKFWDGKHDRRFRWTHLRYEWGRYHYDKGMDGYYWIWDKPLW